MLGQAYRAWIDPKKLLASILLVAPVVAGCGRLSPEQQLDAAFQNDPKAHRLQLAKFAGTVTIDNQPPADEYKGLYVVLVDADQYKDSKAPHRQAAVKNDGHFSFETYLKDDGAPVGQYVVLFVAPAGAKTSGRPQKGGRSISQRSSGPDSLKNRYNDPEVNAKDPQFVLDLKEPGVTDKTFDLKVVGMDAPPLPGNYAVRSIQRPPGP
jgi:hypothetical protein